MKVQFPFVLFLLIFTGLLVKAQERLDHEQIRLETDQIYDKLRELRRTFQANPELAGKEKHTQATIQKYLQDLGMEVETGIYGHSVVGILKGKKKGKKIAWRADMDALPTDFPEKVEFKSKVKGVQHGCGHDVHLAIGLGIAEVLAKNRESLVGTVYFIFQPEEETFVGAKRLIENGLLSKIKLDEIYSLHVTALPVGQLMVKPNEMFAYQKRIRIELKNELSQEELKNLYKKLYKALFRVKANSKPWELQAIDNPEIGLSNSNTIFSDYLIMDSDYQIRNEEGKVSLEAYLYETKQSNLSKVVPMIKRLIEEEYKDKLISVSFIQENPTVVNDKKLTVSAMGTLSKVYGNDLVVPDYGQVPYFNDDFAYFQQQIPGVYFFLGGSNKEKGIVAMNHTPDFNIDEECIRIGVRSFSSLIVERLKGR